MTQMIMYLLLIFCVNKVRQASTEEIEALTELYRTLNGPAWFSNRNWNEGDPCDNYWFGIKCNSAKHVISISFDQNGLQGIVTDSIIKLSYLEAFYITNPTFLYDDPYINQIFYISPKLFSISTLKEVVMRYINLREGMDVLFSEVNPDSAIEVIDFSFNFIKGNLLSSLSLFTKLKLINLSSNSLEGNLNVLDSLSKTVTNIKLQNNFFSGELPSLNNLKSSLVCFDIRNNTLITGNVPNEYFSKNDFLSLKYVGLMLTKVNAPKECKNIPFCIKELLIDKRTIYDTVFDLNKKEVSYLIPR